VGDGILSEAFMRYLNDRDGIGLFFKAIAEFGPDDRKQILHQRFIESLYERMELNGDLVDFVRQFEDLLPEGTIQNFLKISPACLKLRGEMAELKKLIISKSDYWADHKLVTKVLAELRHLRDFIRQNDSPQNLEEARKLYGILDSSSLACVDAIRTGAESFVIGVQLLTLGTTNVGLSSKMSGFLHAWDIEMIKDALLKISLLPPPIGVVGNGNVELTALLLGVHRVLHKLPWDGVRFLSWAKGQARITSYFLHDDQIISEGLRFRDIISLFEKGGKYEHLLDQVKPLFPLKGCNVDSNESIEYREIERILMFVIWHRIEGQDTFLTGLMNEGSLRMFVPEVKKMPLGELTEVPGLGERVDDISDLAHTLREHLFDDGVLTSGSPAEKLEIASEMRATLNDLSALTLADVSEMHSKYGINLTAFEREDNLVYEKIMSTKAELGITQKVVLHRGKMALEKHLVHAL
jgi:hypothetical protein